MTNYATGHLAEKYAAEYLEGQGYRILALNWRTKYCEVDIIAIRKKRLYFIEVKYRKNSDQGKGLEYITAKKLNQMKFAAKFWATENQWNRDYTLGAIEVSGPNFAVTQFLPDVL